MQLLSFEKAVNYTIDCLVNQIDGEETADFLSTNIGEYFEYEGNGVWDYNGNYYSKKEIEKLLKKEFSKLNCKAIEFLFNSLPTENKMKYNFEDTNFELKEA